MSEIICRTISEFICEPTDEEIVRCKDCEFYEPNTYSHFTCKLLQFYVEPDGFCAWGDRKVVGE